MHARPSDAPRYTLLLVDDNEQNLELLEIYMSEVKDARIVTARNGVEAMEAVARHRPDLV
ncbi:MAG: response regulator, partial [Phycisphaerales bacterium]